MKTQGLYRGALAVLVVLVGVTIGLQNIHADERAPGWSSGFNLGTAWLREDDLGTGFSGRVFLEYAPYVHEIALKLGIGYLRFEDNVTLGQGAFSSTAKLTFSDLYFTGGLVYRFSRGNIVPFLTGNLGVYHYNKDEVSPAVGPILDGEQVSPQNTVKTLNGNDLGMNFGGGFEFFVGKRSSISVEMLVHLLFGEVDDEVLDVTAMFRFFPKK